MGMIAMLAAEILSNVPQLKGTSGRTMGSWEIFMCCPESSGKRPEYENYDHASVGHKE
jgi:hypothetical protein